MVDLESHEVHELGNLGKLQSQSTWVTTNKDQQKRGTNGTTVPATTTDLEPTQVAAERGGAEYCVGVLLDFAVRQSLLGRDLTMPWLVQAAG